MNQHPVPQHIASYEFRLIGDMTLKQFGMLAGCAVIALIFYASGLPAYFKWPLILFFILLGIGLAFVPIEERPMHQWLMAFFKAVYSPTQFIWRKENQKVTIFESEAKTQAVTLPPLAEKPKADTKQLEEYLQTLPGQTSNADRAEASFLNRVGTLFESSSYRPAAPAKTDRPEPAKVPPVPIETKTETTEPPPAVAPPPAPPPPPAPNLSSMAYSPTFYKPQADTTKKVVSATTGLGLPIPQAPKAPNLPVGMVLDPAGGIVENAIIEIRDSEGLPARALKTNKLGQFHIVTPLRNGTYEIEVEKPGLEFDIIKLELTGNPVPPLEIRAKA